MGGPNEMKHPPSFNPHGKYERLAYISNRLHCGVSVPRNESTRASWNAFHSQVERNLDWVEKVRDPR